MACEHQAFLGDIEVNRLTDMPTGSKVVAYIADIMVHCRDCGERFVWVGVPTGVSPRIPMRSVDGFTLAAPLRPAGGDEAGLQGLPGFEVKIVA